MPQAKRDPLEIAESHPFLKWYGQFHAMGVKYRKGDIMVSPLVADRFSIGVEEDGAIVIGVHVDDVAAITSIPWTSAALIQQRWGGNWIALAVKNFAAFESGTPTNLYFYLPIASMFAETLAENNLEGRKLRLRAMRAHRGKMVLAKVARLEVPMTTKMLKPKLVASNPGMRPKKPAAPSKAKPAPPKR